MLNSVVCCRKYKLVYDRSTTFERRADLPTVACDQFFVVNARALFFFFFCRRTGGGDYWQTRQHCQPTDRHDRLIWTGVGARRRRRQRRWRSTEVLCFGRMLSSARRPSSHTNYCYGRPARRGSLPPPPTSRSISAEDIPLSFQQVDYPTFISIYRTYTYHTRGTGNNDIMYIPRLGTPTHPHIGREKPATSLGRWSYFSKGNELIYVRRDGWRV